ncbi:MAG: sigma-E processing peptidase SpoIIGA, partial [Bacilli bacterium]
TGNQLRDPITRAPVVIIESHLLKGIVPDAFLQSIHELKDDWNTVLNDLDDEWGRRFRMIPFRSISKDSQFMMALKPDKIVIWQDGKTSESNKVLIGIDSGQLSSDGTYRAIVHPGLIVNN